MKYTSFFDDKDLDEHNPQDLGKQVAEKTAQVAMDIALANAATLLLSFILGLIVTNYHEKTLKGDKNMSPTRDDTVLDSQETVASHRESELAHDEFKAQEGNLAGVNTDANAAASSADATSADVAAAKTEAGSIDTSATALQIN